MTRILGNYFFPEFRTVTQLFDIEKVQYKEESKFDVFTENGINDFTHLNPSMSGVGAYIGTEKIVADGATLIKFMSRTFHLDDLYPVEDPEERNQIDCYLDFAFYSLKKTTDRLTKLFIIKNMIAAGKKPAKAAEYTDEYIAEEWESESVVLLEQIIPSLEESLSSRRTPYLTGTHLTVADLAVFNELLNVLTVLRLSQIDSDKTPLVAQWFKSIASRSEVSKGTNKFLEQFRRLDPEQQTASLPTEATPAKA